MLNYPFYPGQPTCPRNGSAWADPPISIINQDNSSDMGKSQSDWSNFSLRFLFSGVSVLSSWQYKLSGRATFMLPELWVIYSVWVIQSNGQLHAIWRLSESYCCCDVTSWSKASPRAKDLFGLHFYIIVCYPRKSGQELRQGRNLQAGLMQKTWKGFYFLDCFPGSAHPAFL